MNTAMINFTDRAAAALLPLAEKIGQIMQNYEAPTLKMSKKGGELKYITMRRMK
ncbi:hypothetical protein Metho_1240 [Methanomethylovorans hollandica DSM 15978]|uniref:Uncharacterized protein n=2 Tax=Methanomethylovorans hollandica TaxID=101192 RepID=L0KXQ0_METHD|nr:hypothetical protein Metho_1240 [Methanomethylovorans hollandica DSM 15978]